MRACRLPDRFWRLAGTIDELTSDSCPGKAPRISTLKLVDSVWLP